MSQPGCEAVQATNDDASECKRCAVKLGYWDDPYISLFVRGTERKAPEINRGYFARTKGVGIFIDKFLKKCGGKCQLINLGSGFDTLYWRLKDSGQTVSNFIELDFPTVTARKCYLIKRNKTLLEKIHTEDGEVKLSATDLHAGNYHIVGVDLTNLSEVQSKLNEAEVNYSLPTLFLAECVLVYVEVPRVEELLSWIAKDFSSALFVNYEQEEEENKSLRKMNLSVSTLKVNMSDKFGEVMLSNLRSRGCLLAGVAMCQSLETQKKRFLNTSWDGARAWDMVQIYSALPASERQRIERIEFLDEQELLTQLFQHYCIVIAWKEGLYDMKDAQISPVNKNIP